MGEEYVCEQCGGTFDDGRPDEEANAEALVLWGVPDAAHDPGMARVCEDCFQAIMRGG